MGFAITFGMKLSPLRETEQIGEDKSISLFSKRRNGNYDDDDESLSSYF